MNAIQIFQNEDFGEIRAIECNGEVWCIGKDVAEALGYNNSRDALAKHVNAEDKATVAIHDGSQNRHVVVINESGIYALIFGSKLPNAKYFKRWVTSEVLPSIRKHGLYAMDEVLENPDMLIDALLELKKERQKNTNYQETIAVQKQQIAEMRPKAGYYDVILNCVDLIATTLIAKDYGWSAKKLNAYLNDKGVQFKQGNTWVLYQKYAEHGYTSTKTQSYAGSDGSIHTKTHTYWTQKGRLFIYDLLKKDGILPLIENK